jgi:predicted DCC family thiol-disulfide oxidoreductase YuxK
VQTLLGQNGRILTQPWQAIPQQMMALGLTDEDGLRQVWFVDENGRLTGGAEAVNGVMKAIWWLRPLAHLYHIPGLKQLQDYAYRWVANNRYRLPGGTAECAIEQKRD